MLNSFPLYRYTTFCLSLHHLMTPSCFHFGAIMNNAINIHLQVFVWICFHFSWVNIFWIKLYVQMFEELPNGFPIWKYHFTFSSVMYEHSYVSTSLATIVICGLFDYSHSDKCEAISFSSSDLHFRDVEHLFCAY